ncbi:hypothetical protein N9D12_00720 [Candidatus Pelagibacter sp.]|nr:hypothetical protein [Candidatus Pelagibacter sp.]
MPRLTQSEIHSDFSTASETWSEYRAQVIAFYDNYPHSELNDHITREFNKKIRDLGQAESLYISPYNAGLRYIGDGVFTVDPLSFNPYFYIDAASSMLGVLESPSLDLNPAVPSTLDIITATRAGTATYTDASGNIQTASPNTVRVDHVQGEQLTPAKYQRVKYTDFSSGWNSIGATSQAGNGYLGQPSLIVNAPVLNARKTTSVPTETGVSYTASFYVRYVSGSSGLVWMYRQFSGEGITATPITVTSEWTRVQVQFTGGSGSAVNFGVSPKVAGESVEIAMPQVEEGTTASDFVENTTGSPKYFAAATYAPRVPMMLIEPAATNLVSYSEDFSESLYVKDSGVMIGTTNHVSPAGSQDATKIEVTDSGRIYTNLTSATYATSLYLKSGTFSHFKIAGNNLDLQSQTFAGGTIEFVGDGWYRISYTYTGTRPFQVQAYPDANYSTHTDSGDYYIWGAQVETGTVATSYIPTSGSAVTRAADDLVIDGSDFTNFYNQSEGTVYVEYEPRVLGTINTALEFSDGSTDNRIFSLAVFAYHCYIVDGGVNQAVLDGGTNTAGVLNRLAFSYEANNIQASLDGGAVVNDTSASIPTVDRLTLGNQTVFNTRHLNGHIKRLIYWPHHSDNI